jgi:hypothetical protein
LVRRTRLGETRNKVPTMPIEKLAIARFSIITVYKHSYWIISAAALSSFNTSYSTQ